MPEQYALTVVCPLGTLVGPGRYGMYWVARSHVTVDDRVVGTVFQSAMPADLTAANEREEPHSVAEIGLRLVNRRS